MTMVVKLVGSAVPVKGVIADLTVRGISDMVPAIGGTINLQGTVFPVTMMCLVIRHRVREKPVIIRTLSNQTKDGVRHQDMTMVVKLVGSAVPVKEVIADLTVR